MGTWDYNNFNNDDAAGFIFEVIDLGLEKVIEIISVVAKTKESDYLEAPMGSAALVVIEIMAAIIGKQSKDFPEALEEWLKHNKDTSIDENIILISQKAIDRIMGNQSEIKELWQESDDYVKWCGAIEDLRIRIM